MVDLYARKSIPAALSENIEEYLRDQIAAQIPENVPVELVADPASEVTIRDLKDDDELSEAGLIGRLMLPFVFVFLYFMATSTTAQFLMSGVVEEKENRLMEILATSLRPIELLWGKMLGLGALALTQVVIWSAAGIAIAAFNENARDFLTNTSFQLGDILLIVALFVINFLFFAAMMMGMGAAVTAEAESRQIAGVFTFIMVLPMALLATFFTNPNGPLPTFFTFFPFTAAIGLIMRMGMTTLPTWQIVVSVAIQVVMVIVTMWLAAKVFRLGMLMYGKPLTPRTFWQALREGRSVLTTATAEFDAVKPTRKKRRLLR
jgi:ABC-2 type transport system permease protein